MYDQINIDYYGKVWHVDLCEVEGCGREGTVCCYVLGRSNHIRDSRMEIRCLKHAADWMGKPLGTLGLEGEPKIEGEVARWWYTRK